MSILYNKTLGITHDPWISERVWLIATINKSIKRHESDTDSSVINKLNRIKTFLLTMDTKEYGSEEEWFNELAFCYPKFRAEKDQTKFIPISNPNACLHIHPEKEVNLQKLKCPYCQSFLDKLLVNKEYDIYACGCLKCKKGFTPEEIIQIYNLQNP